MIDDSDTDGLLVIHHHVEDLDQEFTVCLCVAVEVVVIQVGEEKVEAPEAKIVSEVFVDCLRVGVLGNHGQDAGRLTQVSLAQLQTANGRLI